MTANPPDGWWVLRLGDAMARRETVKPAATPDQDFALWSVPAYPSDAPEVVRGAAIGSTKQRVLPGDVLLCKINPRINRVWVVRDSARLPQIASMEWVVLRREGVDPRFLARALSAPRFREALCAEQTGVGGSLTRARPQEIRDLTVPIAPPDTQRRIVAKLDELLAKSRAAREQLDAVPSLVEKYRQSVLAAAFRGDLTADWRKKNPDVEPASKLLERIRLERRKAWETAELAKMQAKGKLAKDDKWKAKYVEPAPVDPTGLPELPPTWCWVTVGELLFEPLCNGISVNGSDSPPGVAALKLSSMTEDGFDYRAVRYLPLAWADVADLEVKPNDFFVSRGNGSLSLVGRGVLAQAAPLKVIFPDTMIRLRCSSLLSKGWLNTLWPSSSVRAQVEARVKTTAGIYKISQPQIESIRVPLAPALEQVLLMELVQSTLAKGRVWASAGNRCGDGLRVLDRAILAEVFAGELPAT